MRKKVRIKRTRVAAANDNNPTINSKDVPVADRGHWLGSIDEGVGFSAVATHPYRTKVRYGKDSSGRWDFSTPLPPVGMKISVSRTYKAPPVPKGGYRAIVTGRQPTAADAKWASEGLPIDVEFKNERIAGSLWTVAADFADCYETANTDSVVLNERRIYARQVCQFLRFRLLHLWRPLVDATVFGETMAAIGRDYGGNKEDSAKLGRQKVIDALLIARDCFWDLHDVRDRAEAAIRSGEPLRENVVVTLGRKSADLPEVWHRAANDNRKAIVSVA